MEEGGTFDDLQCTEEDLKDIKELKDELSKIGRDCNHTKTMELFNAKILTGEEFKQVEAIFDDNGFNNINIEGLPTLDSMKLAKKRYRYCNHYGLNPHADVDKLNNIG